MSDSNSKIFLAVGVTALAVTVVLIGGFLGFLYLRQPAAPARLDGASSPGSSQSDYPSTPRAKGATSVSVADITKVSYLESSMSNRSSAIPAAYFGNINTANYSSSSQVVTFSSDGTATKETSGESTAGGVKQAPKNGRFTATLDTGTFAALARVLADNDFSNEPDSRDITSLPIKKVLTITYNGGEKVINTGHMGRNSIETSAMLAAVKELENKVSWQSVK